MRQVYKNQQVHVVWNFVLIYSQEPWLAHVDANNLKLNVVAYFGEVKLQSHQSKKLANVISTTQDSYGNTIYQVSTGNFIKCCDSRSEQTVQTQIRLLQEQSDLGLHCLLFRLHLLDTILHK